MSRAILLFARSPHREAAAKRLPHGAPLFRTLIAAWLRAARAAGAVPVVACSREDREELAAIEPAVAREWIEQRDGRFGDRVAEATAIVFETFDAVIVAAIDAPPFALDRAFASLEKGVPVIAPARDGGINFIGLTAPETSLVSRLTPRRRDLVALCRRWFDALLVLEPVTDVDSANALHAARHERVWRGYLETETTSVASARSMPSPREQRAIPSRAPPV